MEAGKERLIETKTACALGWAELEVKHGPRSLNVDPTEKKNKKKQAGREGMGKKTKPLPLEVVSWSQTKKHCW